MRTYKHDAQSVAREPREVAAVVRMAAELANRQHDRRTVDPGLLLAYVGGCETVREMDAGRRRWWEDGGGVVREGRGLVYTSVLGAAWFLAADGWLHYRVVADRIVAPMSETGGVGPDRFGLHWTVYATTHIAAFVYPELFVSDNDRERWRRSGVDLDALKRDPVAPELWAELERWAARRLPREGKSRIRRAQLAAEAIRAGCDDPGRLALKGG